MERASNLEGSNSGHEFLRQRPAFRRIGKR